MQLQISRRCVRTTWPSKMSTLHRCSRPRRPLTAQAVLTKHSAAKLADTVEKYFVQVLNKHDLEALESVASPDIVFSDRCWSTHDQIGLNKLRTVHEKLLKAYPDYSVHLDSILARDDSNVVMVHWTAKGTCSGDFHGLPATGKRSVMSGVNMFLFKGEGEKISEIISYRQATEEEKVQYLGMKDF